MVSRGLKKRANEDIGDPTGLLVDLSDTRQLIPVTAAHTLLDFWIVSEPSINVQLLCCRLPFLPSLHFIAFATLKGQTMTTNDHFSPLFEITDYLDPAEVIFVAYEAQANQPSSHAGHTSVTHALTKAHAKKRLNQCATVAHYPQGTPLNPLDSVSKKGKENFGLAKHT